MKIVLRELQAVAAPKNVWVKAPKAVVDVVRAEFKAAGFRIKDVFRKAPGATTPYAIEGLYPSRPNAVVKIVIHPDGSIHITKAKERTARTPVNTRVKGFSTVGKAANKTERKALIAKLVRIRDKDQKAVDAAKGKAAVPAHSERPGAHLVKSPLKSAKVGRKSEFHDSGEATDFIYDINHKIKDKRVARWAKATDDSASTAKATAKLKAAIKAINDFIEELDSHA